MQILGTSSWGDVTKSYWSCLSWFWWGSMAPWAGDSAFPSWSQNAKSEATKRSQCTGQDMRLEALCPKRQPCQGPLLQGELWDTWNQSGVANFFMVGILLGPILSQNHHCFRSCLDIKYIYLDIRGMDASGVSGVCGGWRRMQVFCGEQSYQGIMGREGMLLKCKFRLTFRGFWLRKFPKIWHCVSMQVCGRQNRHLHVAIQHLISKPAHCLPNNVKCPLCLGFLVNLVSIRVALTTFTACSTGFSPFC